MFQINLVENIRTHLLCPISFSFRKSWLLWNYVEKCCRARQVTDDNEIWCMASQAGYLTLQTHTQNIHDFSIATMVTRMCHRVASYV